MNLTLCTGECGRLLPGEAFHKNKNRKNGLQGWCKGCKNSHSKKKYRENQEKEQERSRTYYANHKEEVADRAVIWRQENKEKEQERHKKYNEENADKLIEYRADYYQRNREARLEKGRQFRATPEGKVYHAIYEHNRRAKLKSLGSFTMEDWQNVLAVYGNVCLFPECESTEVHMDHVISVYNNGPNTADNLQPLCRPHNTGKGTKNTDYRPEHLKLVWKALYG